MVCLGVRGTDYNNAGISPKEGTVITAIIPTIVWPQAKLQGGNTAPLINRKLDQRFAEHGTAASEQDPVSPSVSLPSGSFHRPLTLIHQRADKLNTTVTEN